MIKIRRSHERGHINHGWLDSFHTFSFATYYDPHFSGFRDLLVINEDRVRQGSGFGQHEHQNMEIISYVLEGELEHRDSTGNSSILKYGDIQKMSAGSGILHSEFNPSKQTPVHFLQIWIKPNVHNVMPSYEQIALSIEEKKNQLKLIASPDGREKSLKIHQNASIYAGVLEAQRTVTLTLPANRHSWVQIAQGAITLNDVSLNEGDGASTSDETELTFKGVQNAEILIFDLE